MAYVSSNTFAIKDSAFDLKYSRTPTRSTQSIKPKILSSTLNSFMEGQGPKKFTEVLMPKKKPIHERDPIKKTRTLPSIKKKDSDIRQNSTFIKLESNSKNTSVISLNDKSNNSQKNTKINGFLKPIDKATVQIKIQIKNQRVRRSRNKMSGDYGDQDDSGNPIIMMTSTTSSMSNTVAPPSLVSTSLSPKTSGRQNLNDDPFYFINILKNNNFTSFHNILEGYLELSCNSFPYYIRIFRKFFTTQPIPRSFPEKVAKSLHDCQCKQNIPVFKPLKSIRLRSMQKKIPSLQALYFSPQASKYSKNLIIVNFEPIFGRNFEEFEMKLQTLSCIRKLSESFRLVLVCERGLDGFTEILVRFSGLGISVSAGYRVVVPAGCGREMAKLLDYSRVYQDFSVVSPEKQVLVLATHRISDSHLELNENFIALKTGLTIKINVDRCPVPSDEYQFTPLSLLLNNWVLSENSATLKKIVRHVVVIEKINPGYDSIHFKFFLCNLGTKVLSSVIHQAMYSLVRGDKPKSISKSGNYCKLHRRYTQNYKKKYLESMFLI